MTQINRVAGRDHGRVAALSDGVFAFAATVLVLDIHLPDPVIIHSEAQLLSALAALWPQLLAWVMSLMTLGIFWVGQQTHLHQVERANRDLTWLNFLFLVFVTLLPFSTKLLAAYFTFRSALVIYWLNILCCGMSLLACTAFADRAGLLKPDAPSDFTQAFLRRIIIAQVLYAFGAAIGMVSIPLGVGFIGLVQLNYAIAPRIALLWNL